MHHHGTKEGGSSDDNYDGDEDETEARVERLQARRPGLTTLAANGEGGKSDALPALRQQLSYCSHHASLAHILGRL